MHNSWDIFFKYMICIFSLWYQKWWYKISTSNVTPLINFIYVYEYIHTFLKHSYHNITRIITLYIKIKFRKIFKSNIKTCKTVHHQFTRLSDALLERIHSILMWEFFTYRHSIYFLPPPPIPTSATKFVSHYFDMR